MDSGERQDRVVSHEIVIDAPAAEIFEVLADPRQHQLFDGSGSVKAAMSGPERLSLGASFSMRMRIGLPYPIRNTVVEFEEGRLIAWRHFGHHVWRYELTPTDTAGGAATTVRESFDYRPSPAPQVLELLRFPQANSRGIEQTLPRLKDLVESREAAAG